MRATNHIGLAPNFTTEGKLDVALFLKTLNNLQFKSEGYGVEVASVKVTPSDKPGVIVRRV